MTDSAQIGVTGLAVMGANLARNIARHGYSIAVHNRSPQKTRDFVAEFGHEGAITGTETVEELVAAVQAADERNEDLNFEVTGRYTTGADFTEVSERDLQEGELRFGLPSALVVLVLVFGALVAALMPLALALNSLGTVIRNVLWYRTGRCRRKAPAAMAAASGMTMDNATNLRIVEAVAKQLSLPPEKVPHNIERYGNTTAGTLPILFHECLENGTIKPGMLVCFTALGSGLHWGAALYRT